MPPIVSLNRLLAWKARLAFLCPRLFFSAWRLLVPGPMTGWFLADPFSGPPGSRRYSAKFNTRWDNSGGLSYLLDARERADTERLQRIAAQATKEHLPPGFKPDLGLHLAHSGGGQTTFHFVDVPIYKLGVLPEGIACWSAGIVLGDREYIATFDV